MSICCVRAHQVSRTSAGRVISAIAATPSVLAVATAGTRLVSRVGDGGGGGRVRHEPAVSPGLGAGLHELAGVGSPGCAVLAAALTAVSADALAVATCLLWLPWDPARLSAWLLTEQAALTVVAVCTTALAALQRGRGDPVRVGLLLGLLAASGSVSVLLLTAPAGPLAGVAPAVASVLMVACGACVATILGLVAAPPWAAVRAAVVVACLGLGQVLLHLPHSSATLVPLVVLHVVGCGVLVLTCATLLQRCLTEQDKPRSALWSTRSTRWRKARRPNGRPCTRSARQWRGSSAQPACSPTTTSSGDVVASFQAMVDVELSRLTRLMDGDIVRAVTPLKLDVVLRPLVLRQQARGMSVRWDHSGLWALAAADAVVEVVGVLLENSRQHAPGALVTLETVRTRDGVVVRVSDTGPGVPASLGEDVFSWGVRRPGSSGQGIGLAVARRRARDLGGDVVLERTEIGGARFCLSLDAAAVNDVDGSALCSA